MTFKAQNKATSSKPAGAGAPRKTSSKKIASLMENDKGSLYIKFDKPVKVTTYDGKSVETLYLNLEKPMVTLERLLNAGVITESQFEQRASKLQDMNYLKYEVSVSVPKE